MEAAIKQQLQFSHGESGDRQSAKPTLALPTKQELLTKRELNWPCLLPSMKGLPDASCHFVRDRTLQDLPLLSFDFFHRAAEYCSTQARSRFVQCWQHVRQGVVLIPGRPSSRG